MRHASKETIIDALSLIDSRIAAKVSEQVLDSKQFNQDMADHLLGYIALWYGGYSKTKQRKLDILRRWLANGAKVKEYEVCGNYGYGLEMLTTEATKKEAIEQRKCYDKNEPNVYHSIRPVYTSLIY